MCNPIDLFFIFGAKYLFLAVILIAIAWFLRQPGFKKKEIFIFGCICLPLVFLVSWVAGELYYNPRPFVAEGFKPLVPHKADNGFPSHHVLLAAAVSSLVLPFSRRVSMLLWALTLLIGVSRVYVGVHHMTDVIGSILISLIPVTIVCFAIKYFKNLTTRGALK